MQESELIEAVKKHPELYDINNVNYMRTKLKNQSWCDIAKTLKFKGAEEAKYIWLKLRASYRDARRRHKRCIKGGTVAQNLKPWKYQNQMSFLEPFMLSGTQDKSGFNESEANDDSHLLPAQSMNDLESVDLETSDHVREELTTNKSIINKVITDKTKISLDASEDNSNAISVSSEMASPSVTTSKVSIDAKQKTKFNNIFSLLNKSIQAREARTKEREQERKILWEQKKTKEDPLYNFFMSMYQITKRMPPQYQHIVRSQIFHAVSNAEANILNLSTNQQPKAFSHISNSTSNLGQLLQLHHEHQIKQEPLCETFISNNQNSCSLLNNIENKKETE